MARSSVYPILKEKKLELQSPPDVVRQKPGSQTKSVKMSPAKIALFFQAVFMYYSIHRTLRPESANINHNLRPN